MNEIIFVVFYTALLGITMKVADLLNEHQLKLFNGANLTFGFMWGIFGVLAISSNASVGNLILATVIGFLTRKKLDYLNHTIAASIVIIGFLFIGSFMPNVFLFFYLIFISFGSLRDAFRYHFLRIKRLRNKKSFFSKISWLYYYDFAYPLPALLYSIFTGEWIIFYAAFSLAFA